MTRGASGAVPQEEIVFECQYLIVAMNLTKWRRTSRLPSVMFDEALKVSRRWAIHTPRFRASTWPSSITTRSSTAARLRSTLHRTSKPNSPAILCGTVGPSGRTGMRS